MDLLAREEIPAEMDLLDACEDNLVLTVSRSYEDPVLIKDPRVLANILKRSSGEPTIQADYFATVQTEIKPHMRKIVSDWMLEVTEEQRCQPEVFALAVNYMDRFLAKVSIAKTQFQLLASTCLFLASKFKETTPLPAENLVIYTDNSVSTYEITQWEMLVLNVLQWDLSAVTPYSILDHLLRTLDFSANNNFSSETVRRHAETFVALTATEHVFSDKSPVVVAVACLASALRGLNVKGLDSLLTNLQSLTGMKNNQICECMEQIEVSIGLSMSGASFQPSTPVVAPPMIPSKIIPQQPGSFYQQSTTPTEVMDVSAALVC